jgi:hypothetical protein
MVFPFDAYCDRAKEKWLKRDVEAVRMPYRKKISENQVDV